MKFEGWLKIALSGLSLFSPYALTKREIYFRCGQKRFIKVMSKQTSFFSKCFRIYVQKRPFESDMWTKKDFFQMISKQRHFYRNIDIYGLMDKKPFFFKIISKNLLLLIYWYFRMYGKKQFWSVTKNCTLLEMLIFLDEWTKKNFSKEI